ncbi:MAG: lamin tail domain-containing protein [Candidatus Saccharimonadales bacterium]
MLNVPFSNAASDNIVISQIQLGDSLSASNEFIQIANKNNKNIEVTDLCLFYISASAKTTTKLVCFVAQNALAHLYLPAGESIFIVSNQLSVAEPGLGSDFNFNGGMSGTGGHVKLVDSLSTEIDRVGWGLATMPEGNPAPVPEIGQIMKRLSKDGVLQDTDDNMVDFAIDYPDEAYSYGSLYELQDICSNIDGVQEVLPEEYTLYEDNQCSPSPVDVCKNIDGLQIVVPGGYLFDENSNCQADFCSNLDGLQLVLPDGMELDSAGDCLPHDVCLNLTGVQGVVPDGFTESGNNCVLKLLPLKLNELLPNANGSDDGNEYIEVYNPNSSAVDLMYYVLYIGSNLEHFYSFPVGLIIGPGEYMAFYSDDIKFTLVNTTSSVTLRSLDNVLIDETPYYSDPKDGMAWALIDGIWQFTNRPTPGGGNIPSYIEPVVVKPAASTLKPCAANQYRNPETNRCKLIPTVSSNLTPCKVGQYRSEETGRCRNLASDVSNLIPCAEGQERNPATNRCRSVSAVLAATSLVPCKEGQERNPETNRCRNIISDMPTVGFAVEQTNTSPDNSIVWWSLAGVGVLAVIYGIWEWRQEIMQLVKKVVGVLNG